MMFMELLHNKFQAMQNKSKFASAHRVGILTLKTYTHAIGQEAPETVGKKT